MSARNLDWQSTVVSAGHVISVVPPVCVDVALSRGISPDKLNDFITPSFKASMPDPLIFKDMDKAIARAMEACRNKEKVTIYGDYDVDGATSTGILWWYLTHAGCIVDFYIPERMTEGYGPNVPAMHKIAESGTTLLIVADSGTTAFEPLGVADELGMSILVLDHHTAEDTLPPGIVVNPNRKDETGAYYYLCTAGLAFLFVVGLQRGLREAGFFSDELPEFDLRNLMGLAALGTVADVVHLKGFNRDIVAIGIPHMMRNPGLAALAKQCGIDPSTFTPKTCGFVFGPCINAGGRVDSTKWGATLLTTSDPVECATIAAMLQGFNNDRKAVQKLIEIQSIEQANARLEANEDKVVIVYSEEWHPGVVGIFASRIKEGFDRPAIVIGKDGKGSCRSIDGFNMGAAVILARQHGLLLKGGGHPAAAGLTLDPAKLDEFRDFMNAAMEGVERPPLMADLTFKCSDINLELVNNFARLAPFGAGNPEPIVTITDAVISDARIVSEDSVAQIS
jgi:single-stranded-DNA-specific exonuclease